MIVMLADSRCLPQVVKVILVNLLGLVLSGLYLLILSSLRRNDEVIHECWKDREYMYGMAGYVIVVNLNLAYHLMSSFERDSRYERKRKLWQRRYPDSADPAEEEQKTSTRHKQQPPDPGTIFPGDDQPGEAGK